MSGVGISSGPSQLYTINPAAGGTDTLIGTVTSGGMQPIITDIALSPDGTLFGTSFTTLYSINKTTGVATPITSLQYSGTAESGSANTLTDNDASWTVSQFSYHSVEITGGTGAGQIRSVSGNTTNTLTVSPAWGTIPDATSTFKIGKGLGVNNVNALTFSPSGTLFGATDTGLFVTIDPSTGQATPIGFYGSGLDSSGDLAFGPDGKLYAAATDWSTRDPKNVLVTVNTATGQATRVSQKGAIGFEHVFGLFFDGTKLFGLTAQSERCKAGNLIAIDSATGKGKFVRCLAFNAFGATT